MVADVLVIGAGPAGSALAAQLAQNGLTVTLADRADFPRDKPCGEFLSPQCLPLLQQLGAGALSEPAAAHRVVGMRLGGHGVHAEGRFRELPHGPPPFGFGVRRSVFDDALRRHAVACGARWLPRHAFVDLVRSPDGQIVGAVLRHDGHEREVTARWVVGADGVHSAVARALGVQRRLPWLDQFALVAHFEGVPVQTHADVQLLDSGFFAATTVDAGLYSVNLVVPRQRLRHRTTGDWDAFVQHELAAAPALQERLRAGRRLLPWRGCGPFAHRTTAVWQPGTALVGDAAGYADPMTGEGIYFALFGARALGEALTTALREPAALDRAMRGYVRARARELAPRLRASLWLQRAIRHPWLVRSAVRALRRWPQLADLVVTLTGDTMHPRDLLRPGFWRTFWRSA